MSDFDVERLSGFILGTWGVSAGLAKTLPDWVRKAQVTFPDVDLMKEARRAAMWEAARPSRKKKSVRMFLTNWWSRTQESVDSGPSRVVSLSAARWLKKNNKSPDFLFDSWVEGRGEVTEGLVVEFSGCFGVDAPAEPSEVVSLLSKEA